jgi:hypothetical protein
MEMIVPFHNNQETQDNRKQLYINYGIGLLFIIFLIYKVK